MTQARSESEIVTLRKLGQELASERKERTTSVHLLAAIASRGGPAAELLRERRLDAEALLKASRSFDEDAPDPIGRAIAAARELHKRSPAPEPGALHLLLALLADRRSAASRALLQCGVDLSRLRTAAMQLALGVVQARRPAPTLKLAPAQTPPSRGPAGVTVSLVPPLAKPRADAPPAAAKPRTEPPPASERRSEPPPHQKPAVAIPTTPRAAAGSSGRTSGRGSTVTLRRHTSRRDAQGAEGDALELDRGRFPVLSSIGKNLTLAAALGKLEPVVGREDEIERALDVLGKRHSSSPCLVGPAGVGKTAVARGIAHRLAAESGEPGSPAAGPRILVEIAASELCAGTGARGSLAERFAALRAELRDAGGRVILFVDEIHELFGGGAGDEAVAEIKLALARGELRLIGATTVEELRRTIEPDSALARRFTLIEIEEPAEEEAFFLLRSVADGLGVHHDLAYGDDALAAAITWSIRYLPGRALPDKAISILDLAGARLRRKLARASSAGTRAAPAEVGPAEVAHVVAELADLPVERLLETDRERMLGMERLLAERVVGHAEPLARIATILRRNAAGLRGRRPIGSFLLLGPTGVGKTETAKAIAEVLFHSPDAMTRLDMSEYAEAHAVARRVGAPPGYVGHEAGGQLTEAVRRRPYQVLLLDEIEKAHRDVLEAFLQVFDEGRLTDGRGRRVDFTNTVIVLTSNLGAAEAGAVRAERSVGFAGAAAGDAAAAREGKVAGAMLKAAREALPPELYNRIDEVLCFRALARDDVAEIARRLLVGLGEALERRGVKLEVDPPAIDALLAHGGFDLTLGARPMKRAIARLVEAPLAEMILRGELCEGAVAMVGAEEGVVVVDAVPARARALA